MPDSSPRPYRWGECTGTKRGRVRNGTALSLLVLLLAIIAAAVIQLVQAGG